MKIVKSLLVLVGGPILGALVGFYAGDLLIPPQRAHLRPVDRVKVALCAGFGLVTGTTLSVGVIAVMNSRKGRKS